MKKFSVLLGAGALFAALVLNFNYAINDYGIVNNDQHASVLAQSITSGGDTSGGNSSGGDSSGGDTTGGGDSSGGDSSGGGSSFVFCSKLGDSNNPCEHSDNASNWGECLESYRPMAFECVISSTHDCNGTFTCPNY
jgi:hypothetical protein